MESLIIKEIQANINNIKSNYCINIPTNNIDTSVKKIYKCNLSEQNLSNLNFKMQSIQKKKDDTLFIKSQADNTQLKSVTLVKDISEIDDLDNIKRKWSKMDNWLRKEKIKDFVKKKYKDNINILQFLLSMYNKGFFKKTSKDFIFDFENQEIETINYVEFNIYLEDKIIENINL